MFGLLNLEIEPNIKTRIIQRDELSEGFVEFIYELLFEKLQESNKDADEKIEMIIGISAEEIRYSYVLNPSDEVAEFTSKFDLFGIKLQQIVLKFAPITLELETVFVKTHY